MTLKVKFEEYVSKSIKEIDFEKMFTDINDKNEYVPSELIAAIKLTIYWLEIKGTLRPDDTSVLSYYIEIISGEHKGRQTPPEKAELLYLVTRLSTRLSETDAAQARRNSPCS
jgi:hypothetical protein